VNSLSALASGPATMSVLLAEDNAVNQRVCLSLLQRLGPRVCVVGDGAAAVNALRENPYDLVLMDVQMPGIDGWQATKMIRALPCRRRSPVPIIALTASAFAADRERCLSAGMNDHLFKPVTLASFEATLRKWHCPAEIASTNPVALPVPEHSLREALTGRG
jgi:CheY-like chemotaxis protein